MRYSFGYCLQTDNQVRQGNYTLTFPHLQAGRFINHLVLKALKSRINTEKELVNALFKKDWVVYAKRPFGHPKAVLEYLGRYTHKVAISNHRILDIDQQQTTFSYKDYRQGARKLEMGLDNLEFIRRFSLHCLSRESGFCPGVWSGSTTSGFWEARPSSSRFGLSIRSLGFSFRRKSPESWKPTIPATAPAAKKNPWSASSGSPNGDHRRPSFLLSQPNFSSRLYSG